MHNSVQTCLWGWIELLNWSDKCDFAVHAGLSILVITYLLCVFMHNTLEGVRRKIKTSNVLQFCLQKCLVIERMQSRMAWLIQADGKATVTQIAMPYSNTMQKEICEHIEHQTWVTVDGLPCIGLMGPGVEALYKNCSPSTVQRTIPGSIRICQEW